MDEAALHELLSGRKRGLRATLVRTGLHLASWLYSLAMLVRNLGYDFGLLKIHRSSVPVISIGNITTGGTGKTPFAAWLTNWLIAPGRKPGLLSRGYRSLDDKTASKTASDNRSNQGNDEKLVLDRLCPGVPHLQQRDRVASAMRAVNEFQCDVLILDDGFQHRRLHRDLDLVLVDALQPWGYEYVLPRGLLREDLHGLRRAGLILITRIDQCSPEQRLMLRARLLDIRGTDEHVGVAFKPQKLVDLNWQSWPLERIAGKKVLGFCGVGNPDSFRRTLASLGVTCEELQVFPDHHHYSEKDLVQLASQARERSADVVLTTQKDLVKISSTKWTGPPLFAIEIGVEFVAGQDLLESRIRRILS